MSNDKQTQTIDLQPLFDTLKSCGFTDITEIDPDVKAKFQFNYELSLYYGLIKANILMSHTGSQIILEVEIADRIGNVDSIKLNNLSMFTGKDIMRMIIKKIDYLLEETRRAAFTELNNIVKF